MYFLWSCLTDAVRSDAVASRKIRGIFTSKTHFQIAYNAMPGGSYAVALNAASGSVSWTYHVAVYFALYQPVLVGGVLYESEIATDLKL